VVTLEVRGAVAAAIPAERPERAPRTRVAASRATVHAGGRSRAAAVWARETLAAGARVSGPAVVLDAGATLWIPDGWHARVRASGALVAVPAARRTR
jgi:N-methylhydantoinase A/oxoprolinase/acetone carboxylase beta subunit